MNIYHSIAKVLSQIRLVKDAKDKEKILNDLIIKSNKVLVLSFVNAHAVNLMFRSSMFLEAMSCSDIILRDGKGLEILFKKAGIDPGDNMNGTDFIPEILTLAKGMPIAIYGTEEPWLSNCAARLKSEGHVVNDFYHGFERVDFYAKRINNIKVNLVLLAMGMPRQEELALELVNRVDKSKPLIIICGGAIVDFYGKKFSRAPLLMRKLGFEWLYRFLKEPRRLFSRYILGNAIFLLRMAALAKLLSKVKNQE